MEVRKVSKQSQVCSRKATLPGHSSNNGMSSEGRGVSISRWDAKTETVAKKKEGRSVA